MVELVIKIPEELYEAYKSRPPMLSDAGMDMIAQAIANGTLLPKGHGDLIDRGKLKSHFIGTEQGTDLEVYLEPTIIGAKTIIEVDTAESEG